jgi:hypothetical protein
MDLSVMNQFLETEDYPLMSEMPFSVELGMTKYYGPLILGGTLTNFMSAQSRFRASQIAIANLNFHHLNIYVGMPLWRKDLDFLLYPSIGIAGGLAQLKYQPLGRQYPLSYWTGGAFANAALTFSRFTLMPDNAKYRLHWGITAGYNYPIDQIKNSWGIQGLAADTAIPVRPEGFYVRLVFGMARLGRNY